MNIILFNCCTPKVSRNQSEDHARFLHDEIPVCCSFDVDWPKEGRIAFENVHLMYQSAIASTERGSSVATRVQTNEMTFALNDISLVVEAGEHVGVVGRTGSGKSSLLRVLFRLVPHFSGPVSNPQAARLENFFGATGTVSIHHFCFIAYLTVSPNFCDILNVFRWIIND